MLLSGNVNIWVINVEAHAAHCRMANAIVILTLQIIIRPRYISYQIPSFLTAHLYHLYRLTIVYEYIWMRSFSKALPNTFELQPFCDTDYIIRITGAAYCLPGYVGLGWVELGPLAARQQLCSGLRLKCNYTSYRTVLYCTVLYCTVLYCTVLYCTVWLQSISARAVSELKFGLELTASYLGGKVSQLLL